MPEILPWTKEGGVPTTLELRCTRSSSPPPGAVKDSHHQVLYVPLPMKVNKCKVAIARCGTLKQSVTNMFKCSNIQIFLIRICIWIFVRIIFWIQIYSDICLCQLFGYKYIRIFVRSKILIRIYSDFCLYQLSDSDDVFV